MKEIINDLTLEEVAVKRDELIKNLSKLRFDMVLGHVENPMEKRTLRRSIARLNTVIHEMKHDIRKA